MSELPTLPSRYPSLGIIADLSPYLVNGLRARSAGSCMARVEPNWITFNIWVAPTAQTPLDAQVIIERLPEELRILALDQVQALHGSHQDSRVIFQPSGGIYLDFGRQRYIRDADTLKVTLGTARRAT